jgi:hypothetical protein
MKALHTLAKMLGVPTRLAEDALHSESAARAVLSRRNLFAAGAAMAAGSLLVGGPLPLYLFSDGVETYVAPNLADANQMRLDYRALVIGDPYDDDEIEELDPLDQRGNPRSFAIWDDDEGVRLGPFTPAEWARREGPGFLCTTEY